MTRLTSFSLQILSWPVGMARRHRRDSGSESHDVHSEPERLERMAAYARAGYFDMGYTFETFPVAGDLPPD